MHVRPQVPAIQDGPESEEAYDVRRPMTPALRDAAKRLLDVVDRQAARGAPMWPFVASSLYGAFLRGDTKGARVFAVIWDSSPFGYGIILRSRRDRDGPGTLVVGTLDGSIDASEQIYREAEIGRAHV